MKTAPAHTRATMVQVYLAEVDRGTMKRSRVLEDFLLSKKRRRVSGVTVVPVFFGSCCAEQIWSRLSTYRVLGHHCDKLEILVLGGTINSNNLDTYFRDIYYAANTCYIERIERLSLADEKRINKTSAHRIIGITVKSIHDRITPQLDRTHTIPIYRILIAVCMALFITDMLRFFSAKAIFAFTMFAFVHGLAMVYFYRALQWCICIFLFEKHIRKTL